jgi:hypothetical protein
MEIGNRTFHAQRKPRHEGGITQSQGEDSMKRRDFLKVTAFSSNGYSWFQVAEVGYDNFMARHAQS